jgi:acyl-coenzyme A thioesterase PaaI-like protein
MLTNSPVASTVTMPPWIRCPRLWVRRSVCSVTHASNRAGSLADELEGHVVPWAGDEPRARFAERSVQADQADLLAAAMPFDVVIGSCNPVALPLTVEFDPPKAIGLATFTAPYEGAPGCVHGAVLAGAFDIMLTAANVIANGAGPTVNLSIRYLKPTLVAQPARFEAWVTEQTDRRTHSRGHLIQGGIVTVEATGEFVNMDRTRIGAMHRRGETRHHLGREQSRDDVEDHPADT